MKKVIHGMAIKLEFVQDFEGYENLKDSNEFANDVVQHICDEATFAGAVASYEIIETTLDVK